MRKSILLLVCLVLFSFMFTGCSCEHEWENATCEMPKTCLKCGETEGEPLSHNWLEATCTEARTCSLCGKTDGDSLGHDWDEATCLTPQTCSVCDFSANPELADHKCENWDEVVDATCIELGHKAGLCKYCGETVTAEIPLADHSFSDWDITKEPSCTADGEELRTCSVCGLEETRLVDMLPHDFSEWNVSKEPTCKAEGMETRICSGCKLKEERAIEMLPHDLNDWEIGVMPLYNTDGTMIQTCKMCKDTINTSPYTYAEHIADMYTIAGANPGIEVTDVRFSQVKAYGYITIYCMAEVTNVGNDFVHLASCDFDLEDDDGHLLGTSDYPNTAPYIIGPGEKGYFFYEAFSSADEIDLSNGLNVFATIKAEKSNTSGVRYDLSDVDYRGKTPTVTGRITNNTTASTSSTEICSIFRDESGQVMGFVMHYLWDALEPGDTKSFQAEYAWGDFWKSSTIADYEVIAYEVVY